MDDRDLSGSDTALRVGLAFRSGPEKHALLPGTQS